MRIRLRARREPGGVALSWNALPADPCSSYRVLASDALPAFAELAGDLNETFHLDGGAGGLRLRSYRVQAVSTLAGAGPE